MSNFCAYLIINRSLTDTWADTDKYYLRDFWNKNGTNVYSCIKQLFLLKKQNYFLKTLLSVEGWTYCHNFQRPLFTEVEHTKFAKTVVTLIEDLNFDN